MGRRLHRVTGSRRVPPLPEKICAACGRPFTWRKKWEECWERVRFCSDRCRGHGTKRRATTR